MHYESGTLLFPFGNSPLVDRFRFIIEFDPPLLFPFGNSVLYIMQLKTRLPEGFLFPFGNSIHGRWISDLSEILLSIPFWEFSTGVAYPTFRRPNNFLFPFGNSHNATTHQTARGQATDLSIPFWEFCTP